MGTGNWSSYTYKTKVSAAQAAGKSTFDYDNQVRSGAVSTINPLLDPLVKNTGPSFNGQVMREVTITDEHPNPTPVAIILDVTGSNIEAAKAVHAKLPQLFGVLQRQGAITDPQILIAATGDAYTDKFPIQVGQFESDNRIDDMVAAMILEGNGGGQGSETYEVLAYYLARHTYLETWHKQGRKGYAIFIGDEKFNPVVSQNYGRGYYSTHTLESMTGDKGTTDIMTADIFTELQEQYEVFYLCQQASQMYTPDHSLPTWRRLLNENATILENPDTICEFIAALLLQREGGLDIDEIEDELADAGFDPSAIASAAKTLALVGAGGGGGGAVSTTDGSLGLDNSTGTARL